MNLRRKMKGNAKDMLKKHFFIFFVACVIAIFIGSEFTYTMRLFEKANSPYADGFASYSMGVASAANSAFEDLLDEIDKNSKVKDGEKGNGSLKENYEKKKTEVFAKDGGVFATVVRENLSGKFANKVFMAIASITKSERWANTLFIILSLGLSFLIWFFVKNVYMVAMRRVFLEGLLYEKVGAQRFLFLSGIRQWFNSAMVIFVMKVFHMLWSLTIIGALVKHYSYKMVPYIVAENPAIKARDAINLSRKMMNGHKMEYFLNDVTFIGWFALGVATMGISNILFTNAYRTAYFAECYNNLRSEAMDKNLENAHLMNDVYLFEYAEDGLLAMTYPGIQVLDEEEPSPPEEIYQGVRGFVAKWLGVSLFPKDIEDEYSEYQVRRLILRKYKGALSRKCYPTLLHPIPEPIRNPVVATINYMRLYSVSSVVMMFFVFCFIGWAWEFSFHLIGEGEFVNRGVLNGPWLPIYGIGGTFILTVLSRLRSHPMYEFTVAFIMCGIIEYTTSYILEKAYGGLKWWDYTGYFLNLDGRICAEGLLVFGIGGCLIVYMIAPMLDNLFNKINRKTMRIACVVLVLIFAIDSVYSFVHPNKGEGVTYTTQQVQQLRDKVDKAE